MDRVGIWLARDLWPVLRAAKLDPEQLDALARERLTRMLRAAARLPFYRQRLDAAGGPESWRQDRGRPPQPFPPGAISSAHATFCPGKQPLVANRRTLVELPLLPKRPVA